MRFRRLWPLSFAALGLAGCDTETTDTGPDGPDPNANADGDCFTDLEEKELGTDPRSPDTDLDTLTDCDEVDVHGTSPVLADTDGDGVNDPDELACVSSPIDGAEKCYACGWKHNDPGDLVSTGKNPGNVVGDMQLVDQCLETVSLWDFATTANSPVPQPAEYHILFMTAAW